MQTLAIIQRDGSTASALKASMESEGFRTECFTHSACALASFRNRHYALVLLDLDSVDADPFEVCRAARESNAVICLTNDPSDAETLRAFAAGADDCLRRPFNTRELVARVRNILTRLERPDPDESVSLDEVEIYIAAMKLRVGREWVDLSRGEADILSLLLECAPAAVTIAQLLEMLPPDGKVKRGTVESRIKSLRRKLGRERLVSRGAFGYQLVGCR